MSKCIFCDALLDKSTSPEHILLNALGGRKTTKEVICSSCNNTFGIGIDKAITEQVEEIRNMLQLQSGTGNAPPMLRNIKAGNDTLNFMGDGRPTLVKKPFSIQKRKDGNFDVNINAKSFEEIEAYIPHIAAALKIPEESMRAQILQSIGTKVTRRPETIKFSLSFGGENAIRSAAKACLILWTTLVGNNEVKGTPYDDIRQYINEEGYALNTSRTHLDSRFLSNVEMIKKRYGLLFNLICVCSNAEGRVIGHFTLYNLISFQIVLAEKGGSPNKNIVLVSNPLEPATWKDGTAEEFNITFEWLDAPDYSDKMARSKARIEKIIEHYFEATHQQEISRICDKIFDKYQITDKQDIPIELRDQITNELSDRLAKHSMGLPHEEKITPEEIQGFFKNNTPTD